MAVSGTILDHVQASLQGLQAGEASKRIKELADHYGVSKGTVNRWAATRGIRFRKMRATKGQSKAPKEVLVEASALLLTSRRTSNEIPLPACDAKMILEDSGVSTGGVSTGWFLSRMRQEQVSARDLLRPSPHQILLSDHPNHVWQFDVTNCLQYFLDTAKGLGERDTEMTLYKNKLVKTAKTIKKELLRYAVVDHCSGAFFFKYFYASGERAADGSQFLFEAMRPKDEMIKRTWNGSSGTKLGKYRFHGVPFILIADRGSIMTAKANQALFEALRIDLKLHMPGNPRAKGAIEGLMHYINRFEGRLKFQRPADLDELNRWALDWCIYMNAVPKMRDVAPRSVLWSYITAEQLRLCPDIELYRLLIKEPTITRTANGARIISVDNRQYQIEDPQAAGQTVSVVRHPYEYPNIEVHFNGYVWLCKPIPKDEYGRLTSGVRFGEYKSIKQTPTQQAKTEMEKKAESWGLKWKGTGDKRRADAPPVGHESPLKVFGHQADKVGNVEFIEKKGTPLEVKPADLPVNDQLRVDAATVSRGIAARRISFVEFLKQLRAEIGIITPDLNRELRERYESGIDIKEAETVIRAIQEGTWMADESHRIEATG
ncbi:MAG: Integrase core domain protein [Syntrophus sp. PtaB.Bin001]|nr:MAG: Integrase core domain protein [Syntrophus sp. PtaB.Bin001]